MCRNNDNDTIMMKYKEKIGNEEIDEVVYSYIMKIQ